MLAPEIGDPVGDLFHRKPVGSGHDRCHESFVRLDSDRDVDLAEQLDLVLGDARVQARMFAKGGGDELHHDRGDTDRALAPVPFSRARSSTRGLTSSSRIDVSCAALWRLSTIRVAIVFVGRGGGSCP